MLFLYKVLKLPLFYLVGEVRLQDLEQAPRSSSSRDSTMSISKADSERKQDSSDKGGVPFNSGEEYMTIELINQYQSQGKLS